MTQSALFTGFRALPFGTRTPDLLLRCDGGLVKDDPLDSEGRGSWAFVALHPVTEEILHQDYGVIPRTTVNCAEYTAVIQALEWAVPRSRFILVETDSKLVVMQLRGRWGIKTPHLAPLAAEATRLAQKATVRFSWIPREQNTLADELTQRAFGRTRRPA